MADSVDIATLNEEMRDLEYRETLRLKREAEAIALANLTERDCEICDNPIPFARLRNVPTTRYCVGCQSALETGKAYG